MPIQQAFPNLDTPIADPDTGNLSLVWFRFFIALWNRTGSALGNNSASFNYPSTPGNTGQVLTSQGAIKPTIWTALANKLSQFVNDTGFITAEDVAGFSTPDSTQQQINDSALANLSTSIPPADTTTGAVGNSSHVARADHSHPREKTPTYTAIGIAGNVSWTSGSGPPSSQLGNGSIYSRTDGTTGARLYVSDGAVWRAVAGV